MAGFKPESSGGGSDHGANCATTTAVATILLMWLTLILSFIFSHRHIKGTSHSGEERSHLSCFVGASKIIVISKCASLPFYDP